MRVEIYLYNISTWPDPQGLLENGELTAKDNLSRSDWHAVLWRMMAMRFRVTIAGIALIRAVLGDALALDALKWYHDSPGPVAFGRVCSAPAANACSPFASDITKSPRSRAH